MSWLKILRKIDDYRWELPKDYKPGMRVPARIFADRAMLEQLEGDQAIEQAANVATLPGIVGASLAMPDIHWGYGFPIGGVAGRWVVGRRSGGPADLGATESRGRLPGADRSAVSERARQRGLAQLGTLGSGNHFLEVQVVEQVYDEQVARAFGVDGPGQTLVFFHCGSRGFGHQVCQDYLRVMETAATKY